LTLRVVIADDQEMVRSGFRLILESQDITVVGEASDGRTAVDLARRLRPDVCLFDIRMPVLDGLAATRLLAGPAVVDPIPVVVVTTFDLDEYAMTAIRNGASGFLLKDAGPALLIEAVRSVAAGDALVAPAVTMRLLRHFAQQERTPAAVPTTELTAREEEITRAVARGRTNAEIGSELFISLSTVKTHISNVQTKLGVRNRVEIATWAWESGLVK
jgi:DNA-binding NarL/FixJ family response regulator